MRLLIVDDDADAVTLLRRELDSIAKDGVRVAMTLRQGIDACSETEFDCVVLDLSLPDGWGLDSLLSFRRVHRDVPLVVVSGSQAEDFSAKALRAGANRFLSKASIELGVVAEAVADAVRAAAAGEQPITPIEALGARADRMTGGSPLTAKMFGQTDLLDMEGIQADVLVAQYGDLLDLAIEQEAFRADYRLTEHIREVARALGQIAATPRDIVQMHSRALDEQMHRRMGVDTATFVTQARLVLLELMGYLASYYRTQALGRSAVESELDTDDDN